MTLTPQDLSALRIIILRAVNECFEVVTAAARRTDVDQNRRENAPQTAPAGPLPASPTSAQTAKLTYSLPEAARHLSLSRTTLWRLIRSGMLTTVALGSRRVVRAADIDRLLARGAVDETEPNGSNERPRKRGPRRNRTGA